MEDSYELGLHYNLYREKVSPFEVVKNSFFELKYSIDYVISSLKYMVSGKASINEISGPCGHSLNDNMWIRLPMKVPV